jgi:multiple sugar transport system ATP-binding protein
MKAALKDFSGTQLRLGIRPEDILAHNSPEANPNGGAIRTRVDLVEPLGSNALLYLHTQSNNFIARAEGTLLPEHNSRLDVVFNIEKAHLFDPNTGAALTV